MKSNWIEKINKMDSRLDSEIQHYKNEYNAIQDAIIKMNTKISENEVR